MYYSEIREYGLKLSGKSGNYQGLSYHELAGNPKPQKIHFVSETNTSKRQFVQKNSDIMTPNSNL